jgi:ActR/RegA family two-component response regulator
LIGTDLRAATLTGSKVYGVSVWDIKVDGRTKQQNLIITGYGTPAITVDNIKVAQFIYLLLNNQEIRDVIDTITSKAV